MDLIDLGRMPDASEGIDRLLKDIQQRFEVDHVAYAGANPVAGTMHGHVTYGDAWKEYYAANNFQNIDPSLHMARRSIAPVDWRRLARNSNFEKVFANARDFGISEQGLTIPVRGPYGDTGMLSVTRDCSVGQWDKLVDHIIGDLQSVAVHIHDRVMNSDALTQTLRYPNLSTREREILQWIAAGKSQQDIGDILGISHRTVEVHLRSTRDKLGSLTTPQAVARGIAMGLIFSL